MLKRSDMHAYQGVSVKHIIDNEAAGLILDMGLGKTVSALTAVDDLMYLNFEVFKALVIAPKRVASDVWPDEVEKWDHLKHLKVVNITGTEKQRIKALQTEADIYTIGRENTAWICNYYGSNLPFDMLIIDESSSFKNKNAIRFKALKLARSSFNRVVILTGTPAPNSLLDLWPQIFLLDRGERLGKFITHFRGEYFKPNQRNGAVVFNYKIKKDAEQKIYDKIKDICISMKASDYLDLPKTVINDVKVKFTPEIQSLYDEFEREQILSLDAEDITAVNAAALSTKLLQFSNGAVYDEDKNVHVVHDLKIDACKELIEEAQGKPVLIAWTYKHDRDRLMEALKEYKPRQLKDGQDIKDWNAGKLKVLMMHPASGGHGLNLQYGGHNIIWFGQTWSLELYLQFNARLDRQGQKHPVIINRLIGVSTIDQDVVAALGRKDRGQNELIAAIKAKIIKYKS